MVKAMSYSTLMLIEGIICKGDISYNSSVLDHIYVTSHIL